MINNFLSFFLVILTDTLTSELFYIPIIFTLCAYLFYIVINMIRGRY